MDNFRYLVHIEPTPQVNVNDLPIKLWKAEDIRIPLETMTGSKIRNTQILSGNVVEFEEYDKTLNRWIVEIAHLIPFIV
jgi:hypothetical protein